MVLLERMKLLVSCVIFILSKSDIYEMLLYMYHKVLRE